MGIGTQASGALVLATVPQRRVWQRSKQERSRAREARAWWYGVWRVPVVGGIVLVLSGAYSFRSIGDFYHFKAKKKDGTFTVLAQVLLHAVLLPFFSKAPNFYTTPTLRLLASADPNPNWDNDPTGQD